MILHLDKNTDPAIKNRLAKKLEAVVIEKPTEILMATPSKYKEVPEEFEKYIEKAQVFDTDMQLSSRHYKSETREIDMAGTLIGGNTKKTLVIIGPCSVESEEQMELTAQLIKKLGLKMMRAGSFKPRTSPYTFQGMGLEGLKLLAKIREKYGIPFITEVRDNSHVDMVIEYTDAIQIGAKSMYDHSILRKCGKTNKPVLLKRGFGTTIQEFVQASEFILSEGNENVILCERGIRTFETKSRFTLDLCGVAWLKQYSNLPIVLDPSHAMGYAFGVPDLTRACMAMGVDGLLIEVHPEPAKARSDASQQLNHAGFEELFTTLKPIAKAIGRELI